MAVSRLETSGRSGRSGRSEHRLAAFQVPGLDTSRIVSLAQGLGALMPGRGASAPSSCLSGAAGTFGRGLEDVLRGMPRTAGTSGRHGTQKMTGMMVWGNRNGVTNRTVFLGLVLAACLESWGGEEASVAKSVGRWFVVSKGARAQVLEVVRRLVSTRVGLGMLRERASVCLVREMCRGHHCHAHVVVTGLLRAADVLLVEDGGDDGAGDDVYVRERGGDGNVHGVELLAVCFSFLVDAVVSHGDRGAYDGTWQSMLGALEESLLVASSQGLSSLGALFLQTVARTGSLVRLRGYLDAVSTLEAVMGNPERLGAVFRLRTRLLLVDGAIGGLDVDVDGGGSVSEDEIVHESSTCPHPARSGARVVPSMHDVEAVLQDVLYWESESDGERSPHDGRYLAYVSWIACTTLFDPDLPVYNPNPVSYSKLLCRALVYHETVDHPCFPLVAWVLASRVVAPVEQQVLLALNTDEVGRRKVSFEVLRGFSASAMYAWVESQMLLVGNKLAVDDASGRGIVVGQVQEATLRTIRTLLFPCVLFCPYSTLHNAFRLGTANRNDAWLLVAVCEVFPELVSLPALSDGEDDGILSAPVDDVHQHVRMEGELARLLVDRILSGAPQDNESFLYAARSLLQFQTGGRHMFPTNTYNSGDRRGGGTTLWECLPSILLAPPCRRELASDFVLDVVTGHGAEIDSVTAEKLISICLSLLEFDSRYRHHGKDKVTFSKRVLDNARRIVESMIASIGGMDANKLSSILSEIESSGMAPWARLYFGLDFSEYEARYILHTNPKPSHGLTAYVPSVANIRMHQTLELAALGSIQRAELQDLATGYTSMQSLLDDLQASIRCLYSVCTATEIDQLMTGLEIFSSTLFTRDISWATLPDTDTDKQTHQAGTVPSSIPTPRIVAACSTAMVAELCLKSTTPELEPTMVPDICRYCITSATRGQSAHLPELTARLFTELINYYAKRINATSISSINTTHTATTHTATTHTATTTNQPTDTTTTSLETALSVLYKLPKHAGHTIPITNAIHTAFPNPTTTPPLVLALLQST